MHKVKMQHPVMRSYLIDIQEHNNVKTHLWFERNGQLPGVGCLRTDGPDIPHRRTHRQIKSSNCPNDAWSFCNGSL